MNHDINKRLLVVDDEETLCEALRFNLEEEGYEVDVAYSAEEALEMRLDAYSLFLLDVMMGEISGVELAKILKSRQETSRIPIIFCTAKDNEDDMVEGLELGADDYITKPYSIRNVIARVNTIMRRCYGDTKDKSISIDDISIDADSKSIMIDGVELKMPKKEFELFCFLAENRGTVYSRYELLREVWKDDVCVIERVIDVHINRLRRKLGRYGKFIKTRSGYGYGFIE